MLPIAISRTNIKIGASRLRRKLPQNISEKFQECISRFSRRIDKELPEKGNSFPPIEEFYAIKGGKVLFKIMPSTSPETPNIRILKADFTTKTGNKISPLFETGTKRDIQRMLSDKTFLERAERQISSGITTLEKKNLL